MHTPAVFTVTLAPVTVHTAVVCDTNVTDNPEVDVATSGLTESPKVTSAGCRNVMVWSTFLPGKTTLKLCCTGGAGLKTASPAWLACTVQVPTATIAIGEPLPDGDDVHTEGVSDVNVTGSPEVAVALTATGGSSTFCPPSGPNAIVWFCDGCTDSGSQGPVEPVYLPSPEYVAWNE